MLRVIIYSLAAFSLLLSSGCGSDDDPIVAVLLPELALTLNCNDGITELKLNNFGGAMTADEMFEAVFADGERDTLYLRVGSADSISCTLSNIHGPVTVANEEGSLTASSDDCIDVVLADILADFDIQSAIPSPLVVSDVGICTYTIFLRGVTFSGPVYDLLPTNTGLTLRYTFSNIRGNLSAEGSNILCPDLTGSMTITSIVSETEIIIDEGGNPEVSLGQTTSSINGLNVSIGGPLGFLGDLLTDFFLGSTFTRNLEQIVETELNARAGSDLANLVIVNSGCGE